MNEEMHDHEGQEAHSEEGFEHHAGAEEEAWHGEPIDDFSDEPAAMVSEETDADVPVESVEPPRKRSKILAPLIIVGGVIFLGAMVYMQFGSLIMGTSDKSASHKSPMVVQDSSSTIITAAPKTAMIPSSPTANTVAGSTGVSTLVGVGVATPLSAPVPSAAMPLADAPKPSAAPVADNAAMVRTIPSNSSGAIASPASPPLAVEAETPQIKVAQDNTPASPSFSETSAPAIRSPAPMTSAINVPTSSSLPPADDSRLIALNSRVDDLQKSLEQATQQLTQITNRLVVIQQNSASNNTASATTALESRLDRLEQKLTVAANSAPAREMSTNEMPEEKIQPVHKASTHAASTQHHARTSHKSVKVASHHRAKKTSSTRWVLRAATPDQAWIAKNDVTTDLHPIQVGDAVTGIGRVTSIHESGSGWVVVGTKGSIH